VLDDYVEPVVLYLSAFSIPLLVSEAADLGLAARRFLLIASWVIWAAVLLLVVARRLLGDARPAVVRMLPWDLAVIVGQPILALLGAPAGGLGIAVLHVVGVVVTRGRRRVRATARAFLDRPLRVVLGVVVFSWYLWSSVVLLLEQHSQSDETWTLGSALWWGAATMTTVGYGDVTVSSSVSRVIGGIAMLTGIAAFAVVTAKLAELLLAVRDARGHSGVDVAGHTLLLGWSSKGRAVVRELVEANRPLAHASVVVLSALPRARLEHDVRANLPELAKSSTSITFRNGSIRNPSDLARVRPAEAKSIIVLGDEGDETSAVTCLLALFSGAQPPRDDAPVITEITEPSMAVTLRRAFGDRVHVVEPGLLLARVTAQSCRQPGLGLAYEELLDFEGSEFYIRHAPEATGRRFGDVLNDYRECCPVGFLTGDGTVELCPPMDRVLAPDDRLVLLAKDAQSFDRWDVSNVQATLPMTKEELPQRGEHIVVVGWNDRAAAIVSELDHYVPPGSRITVVLDETSPTRPTDMAIGAAFGVHLASALELPAVIERVAADCDHAIVLPDRALSTDEADARALLTTLQIINCTGAPGTVGTVVTELLDEADADLARQVTATDFIVSGKLGSQMMAQIAEAPELHAVFDELLDPRGADLYAKPIWNYVVPGVEATFAAVTERARSLGEIAVGYRLVRHARRPDRSFGVVMNPPKDTIEVFEADDRLIVVARPLLREPTAAPTSLSRVQPATSAPDRDDVVH
jgi:hypothetical protein